METYLTIEDLAVYFKITEQTVRRWILNRHIPFRKIKSVIRFRLSEIERWVDNGGINSAVADCDVSDCDLFNGDNADLPLAAVDVEGEK